MYMSSSSSFTWTLNSGCCFHITKLKIGFFLRVYHISSSIKILHVASVYASLCTTHTHNKIIMLHTQYTNDAMPFILQKRNNKIKYKGKDRQAQTTFITVKQKQGKAHTIFNLMCVRCFSILFWQCSCTQDSFSQSRFRV